MNTNKAVDRNNEGVLHKLKDGGVVKEFYGILLSEVSTFNANKAVPRWTEMGLYKVTDGTGRYVLEIVGCSDLYHEYGGECGSGVRKDSSELPDRARPCHKCNPAQSGGRPVEAIVAMESDRPRVHVCENAREIVTYLRQAGLNGVISGPGQKLLEEAAIEDDGVRSAINTVERI